MAPKIPDKEWRAHRERIVALSAMCERRRHYNVPIYVNRILLIPKTTILIGPWAINLGSVMKYEVTVETAAFILDPPYGILALTHDGSVVVKKSDGSGYREITQRIHRDTFSELESCTANWMRMFTPQHQA